MSTDHSRNANKTNSKKNSVDNHFKYPLYFYICDLFELLSLCCFYVWSITHSTAQICHRVRGKKGWPQMTDKTIARIRKFTEDRDWDQFHTPVNLAKSIVIEAGELLECFQWSNEEFELEHVKEELADVLVYCQNMLDRLGLDADEIINAKMDKNEAKYPVEKARGSAAKYTEL